jgi:hypothetical protein
MHPDLQAVLNAQHLQDLRTEAEERRRAAQLAMPPGPLRIWLSERLITMGEALIELPAAASENRQSASPHLHRLLRQRSAGAGYHAPPCLRLSGSPPLARCTVPPGHASPGCPASRQ